MHSKLTITGWGAVSASGWSAADLVDAELSEVQIRQRDGAWKVPFRSVPMMKMSQPWARQARMRRATTIAKYALSAAWEALGECRREAVTAGKLKVGVIFVTTNGCVQFSRRFYTEVLENPSLASPILFPETVYNAPASHLAALLGMSNVNHTIVGDETNFFYAIELAYQWLQRGEVDGCLIVAAEESDWLTEEAMQILQPNTVMTEGSAAIYLELAQQGVSILQLTDPLVYQTANCLIANDLKLQQTLEVGDTSSYLSIRSNAHQVLHAKTNKPCLDSSRVNRGYGFSVDAAWSLVTLCELWQRQSLNMPSVAIGVHGLFQQSIGLRVVNDFTTRDEET